MFAYTFLKMYIYIFWTTHMFLFLIYIRATLANTEKAPDPYNKQPLTVSGLKKWSDQIPEKCSTWKKISATRIFDPDYPIYLVF